MHAYPERRAGDLYHLLHGMRIAAEYGGDPDKSLTTDQAYFDERAVLHRLDERNHAALGKIDVIGDLLGRRQDLSKGQFDRLQLSHEVGELVAGQGEKKLILDGP